MHPEVWEKGMDEFMSLALDSSRVNVRIGDNEFTCLVASSLVSRLTGLSEFESLPEDGMLFIYQNNNIAPFSRAEMNFDISIWFFDEDGDLVSTGWEADVAVSTLPYRYVLELAPDTQLQGKLEIIGFVVD
jgi:uncharacterized membrane protein (UPF0127 family)